LLCELARGSLAFLPALSGLEWILKNKAVVDDPGSIALFLRAEVRVLIHLQRR
jgi:hypothetical protein